MDASQSRWTTIGMGGSAVASIAFFVAVFAPAATSLAPGEGIRPWSVLSLLAVWLGSAWWLACVLVGTCQLFTRPRRYGLITLGFGVLHFVASRLTEWLMMGSRGIYWAP